METDDERRAKSLQSNLREASKKDAELFNLKTFKKPRNLSNSPTLKDDLLSPASSNFKGNSRFKRESIKNEEVLSPTSTKFGSLKLFPTKEGSSPRSSYLFSVLNKKF